MHMANLHFKIGKSGDVEIEVDNAPGTTCLDLTRAFENALGIKTDSQMKPDLVDVLDGMEINVTEDN